MLHNCHAAAPKPKNLFSCFLSITYVRYGPSLIAKCGKVFLGSKVWVIRLPQTFDFKQIVKFPPQSGLIRRPDGGSRSKPALRWRLRERGIDWARAHGSWSCLSMQWVVAPPSHSPLLTPKPWLYVARLAETAPAAAKKGRAQIYTRQ